MDKLVTLRTLNGLVFILIMDKMVLKYIVAVVEGNGRCHTSSKMGFHGERGYTFSDE